MQQALKIWLAIFPSITLFQFLLGAQLAALPLLLRSLVLTAVLVPWMVFAALPLVNYLLRKIFRNQVPRQENSTAQTN